MSVLEDQLYQLFKPYQFQSELIIKRHIDTLDANQRFSAAYAYALTNGGKRFRPSVVFMIADALNSQFDVSQAALAIELCHTASLIADDLPMMDNDDERRSKPSLHRAFDEATALLTSYAMIADAYAALAANARVLEQKGHAHSAEICLLALENAARNTGYWGATGGQYLDLNPPNLSEETLMEIIQKKTVSLFEVAFVLGWLYGGGSKDRLPEVKETAAHFGVAFQIADDLHDLQQDAYQASVNYAVVCGQQQAQELFRREIKAYKDTLEQLRIATPPLLHLATLLEETL